MGHGRFGLSVVSRIVGGIELLEVHSEAELHAAVGGEWRVVGA